MICARRNLEEVDFPGFTFPRGLVLGAYARYVRLSTVAAEVLLPQSIFALYQREAFLRDSRSLREDSRPLCGRERSVARPDFAECESKNRSSQSSQR
jgi:hypothetical protein